MALLVFVQEVVAQDHPFVGKVDLRKRRRSAARLDFRLPLEGSWIARAWKGGIAERTVRDWGCEFAKGRSMSRTRVDLDLLACHSAAIAAYRDA